MMRNLMMRERLDAALTLPVEINLESVSQLSNDDVLGAVSAVRRKLSKTPSAPSKPALRTRKTPLTGRAARRGGLQDTKELAAASQINPFSRFATQAIIATAETEKPSEPAVSPAVILAENPVILRLAGEPEPALNVTESDAGPNLVEGEPSVSELVPGPFLVPVAPPAMVTVSEDAELEVPPARVLPPNLEWLNKPTPFVNNLRGMVESLRTAKTTLSCRLELAIGRLKEARSKVEYEEREESRLRSELQQIDDTLSACALVAEQSAAIKPDLLAPDLLHKKHHTGDGEPGKDKGANGGKRWSLSDPTACRQSDMVEFFKNNPGINWTAGEIRKLLPAAKQAHAKDYLPVLLAQMFKAGKILKVGAGIYRTLNS
jgi:hypothetical protein